MKSLRSILTTLVSLLVALVVLAALSTLAMFLLYSASSGLNDRLNDLYAEMLRGGAKSAPSASAGSEPAPDTDAKMNQLLNVVAQRDADIDALKRQLALSMGRSRELEDQLQRIVSSTSIPPAPVAAGESEPGGPGNTDQEIGLAPKVAQVQRYDYDYNFVVLDSGLDQSIAVDQILGVRQSREIVARVRVTKVEDNTAVAEVVPGTAMEGRRITEGDDVISLEGLE